jgi:hypothetical protein
MNCVVPILLVPLALPLKAVFWPISSTSVPPQWAVTASNFGAFLGHWDLNLKASKREYPSWLELIQENGELKARMTGRWGNARPLPEVSLVGGKLIFISPKKRKSGLTT